MVWWLFVVWIHVPLNQAMQQLLGFLIIIMFSFTGFDLNGYDQYGYSVDGFDKDHCNYGYNGPFVPGQAARIWGIMVEQEKSFVMSLPKTCAPMVSISVKWSSQTWIQRPKDVTGKLLNPNYSSPPHI